MAKIRDFDSYLSLTWPGEFRLERAADHVRIDPASLQRLLGLYCAEGVIASVIFAVCPSCDSVIAEITSFRRKFFCDLCDVDLERESVASEELYRLLKPPTAVTESFADRQGKENKRMIQTGIATPLEFARIEPWAGLDHQRLVVETPTLGDLDVGRLLGRVERYGISILRMTAQSADDRVLTSLAKLVGPPCQEQNTFQGIVKRIRPEPDGLRNSGDTVADLGLHVDGTQHRVQPALLAFQYVAEAKVGANSIFVDAARVLHDIEERSRYQIMVGLSSPHAATFSKRGMEYTGPIFSVNAAGGLIARLRFDEVIKPHPDCLEDYQELKRRFNSTEYQLVFKPREGDIILFDNWRLLHARDEVLGVRQREHNRMWIANLLPNLQPHSLLGIRGMPLEIVASIKAVNEGRS